MTLKITLWPITYFIVENIREILYIYKFTPNAFTPTKMKEII